MLASTPTGWVSIKSVSGVKLIEEVTTEETHALVQPGYVIISF